MQNGLEMKLYAFTMDCREPVELAAFYAALLEMDTGSDGTEYAWVYPPGTKQDEPPFIVFQRNPDYIPPVWPEEPGAQQQMAHLDIAVNDLEKAVAHAVRCGATVSQTQYSDKWTVMFDPVGHPFCLCLLEHLFPADAE